MRTAELSEILSIPIKWIEPKKTKRDAMALITVTSRNNEHSVLISPRGLMQVDAKNYVLAPEVRADPKKSISTRLMKRFFQIAISSLLTCLAIFAILLAADVTQARVVLTNSMSPAIMPGDIVISVGPKLKSPKVGDVVTYMGRKFDGTPVAPFTHRVVGGNLKSGLIVKGDNNQNSDVQRPLLSDIKGVVIFTIPFVGLLLTPQNLTLILFTFFGAWLILDSFRLGRQ
jgi:signal peptidase I